MAARSPRGSISGTSAADVAADFEDSLKDLQLNNRYEISNLTLIAKENTEHAEAISQTLENHIKTTSPSRKLPALYVLDSIVKNVGTPYTTYLGRNLFRTFMDAYVLVDTTTRRQMEGMLKTWKEPVPGSIDSRPVFPPENVRPIDNALIKAKTAAINNQRQAQPSQMSFRGPATPLQQDGQFMPPPHHAPAQHQMSFPYQPPPSVSYAAPSPAPGSDAETLKRDIAFLISRDSHVLSINPSDSALRTRLQALSDLQSLLSMRTFNAVEYQAIRAQVQQISAASNSIIQPPTPQPPQWNSAAPGAPQLYGHPQVPFPLMNAQLPQSQPPPPVLNPQALSGLQALLANVPKPSTPQMRAALPAMRDASHAQLSAIQSHTAAAAPTSGATDLLSSLAKAGLIKPSDSATPIPRPAQAAPQSQDQTAMLLKSLQSVFGKQPQAPTNSYGVALPAGNTPRVPVSAASLKVFRPDVISALYEAQPNQCSTCGRRFLTTDDAREKKSRHLDWHFRTNQRIADPNLNRGHHRNWFVDELEWVKHVEFDPSTTATVAGESEASPKAKKVVERQFVRAPPGMTKNTCNICFEEMKSSYSEDQQDWIFADATINNGKIVHAQCLADMTKSQTPGSSLAAILSSVTNGTRERSATPDSALGKRKAENTMSGGGARVKLG